MTAHLLVPTPAAWTVYPSLRKKEETKERGEAREQEEDETEQASLVHLEALAGLAVFVQNTQFKLDMTVGFVVPLPLSTFYLELPGQTDSYT